MATSKQPTNSDILSELKTMNTRITSLGSWKIAEDAAKKAIADYKKQENSDGRNTTVMSILKQVGIILGILTAILYAWASTKGLHP